MLSDGVDLLGYARWILCGSCVHWINKLEFQDWLVIPRKWVGLLEGEIGTVSGNWSHQNRRAAVARYGEGMRRILKPSYFLLY